MECGSRNAKRRGRVGFCWAKMRWVFSGEAVTQESLGSSPRNSAPKKSIALKARFQSGRRNTIQFILVTRFQR